MHKRSKKHGFTEKSSLIKRFRAYKEKGWRVADIAKILGISSSLAKKISATIDKKKTETQLIVEKLEENPYTDLDELGLNDAQKDILYKSKEWRTKIKPLRIISEFRNNPKVDHEKVIRKLREETLLALEENFREEWFEVLTIRKEFSRFKKQLVELRQELEEISNNAAMYVPYNFASDKLVDIGELKAMRDSIPQDERYPLPKSATNRLAVSEQIAIMHDFKYLQIVNDILILENYITKVRVKVLRKYISPLHEGTKRLISLYFRSPFLGLAPEKPEGNTEKALWIDIDNFFTALDEICADHGPRERNFKDQELSEECFSYEDLMEAENNEFIYNGGKRFGMYGNDRSGQKLAYAVNMIK